MDKIRVYIGSLERGSGREWIDYRELVEFEGERLAGNADIHGDYDDGSYDGGIIGVIETLYRVADGRLIVHVEDARHELRRESLHHITEGDLMPGGRLEKLGREVFYVRPLTLDEALQGGYYFCDRCGVELPADATPYYVDAFHGVWLCDRCTAAGEV